MSLVHCGYLYIFSMYLNFFWTRSIAALFYLFKGEIVIHINQKKIPDKKKNVILERITVDQGYEFILNFQNKVID